MWYGGGMTFTRRWRGRSKAEVREAMTALNQKRMEKMTPAQWQAQGRRSWLQHTEDCKCVAHAKRTRD